jgi:hypothetical protein
MRKPILLLFFLLILTSTAIAQGGFAPHIFNNNQMYLNNRNNNSPVWTEGSYTDLMGVQHAGFILMRDDDKDEEHSGFHRLLDADKKKSKIYFKTGKHDKKIAIPADSLTVITLKNDTLKDDTFFVSRSSLLKSPFIQLMISNNNIKLYHQYAFKAAGLKDVWYYGTGKDDLTLLKNSNFISVMPQILADRPDIGAKISSKWFHYFDMVDLITYYQTGREPWLDRDN